MLDYSCRIPSGTLEQLQAHAFMSYVMFHLEGFSARGRLLCATAASIAEDLCLHRLDADAGLERDSSVRAFIDREVK